MIFNRLAVHLRTETRNLGRDVTTRTDFDRCEKMLVQVIYKLDRAVFHCAADGYIVGHRQVLDELA